MFLSSTGVTGILAGHPFDTAKVYIQMQDPRNIKYRGTFDCLRSIYAKESFRGLYKGVTSPIGGVAFMNAIIFGVYGNVQRLHSDPNSLKAHFIAGSLAGCAQSIISSPMELVKTRMQLQHKTGTLYKSSLECLNSIWKRGGARGVFQGFGITALRDVPGISIYFVSYEMMVNKDSSTFRILMAGGMAGVVSWIFTYPLDIIKTRLQMDTTRQYTGMVDCIKQIYAAEGPRGFSRGLSSCLIRAFPTNAACFAAVTTVIQLSEKFTSTQQISAPLEIKVKKEKSALKLRLDDDIDYITRIKANTIRGLTLMGAFHEDSIQRTEIYELTNNLHYDADQEIYLHFHTVPRNRSPDSDEIISILNE